MPFIDPGAMIAGEPLPGWHGRFWRSQSMSFAHYTIDAGASIHEHHHPHEEVWIVIEGEIEVTIAGVTRKAGPGTVAIVPPDELHSVRALSDAAALIANHPVRDELPGRMAKR
jgi:quercetin dioxygenase-like cupin family protein